MTSDTDSGTPSIATANSAPTKGASEKYAPVLAQTLGTLAETVEGLLASSRRQNRGPARPAWRRTRQASSVAENEAAPEPHD